MPPTTFFERGYNHCGLVWKIRFDDNFIQFAHINSLVRNTLIVRAMLHTYCDIYVEFS